MELNNIIFTILIFFFSIFFNKYLLFFLKKTNSRLLSDDQFKKPQAFHVNSTYRLGGFTIFSLLAIVFLYLFFSKNIFFFEYISFCSLFFVLGFLDDLRIYLQPKFRLLIMIVFLVALIIINEFYIERISLEYLNHLLKIDIFSLFFVCLCFLFIINGSNLIDGFNGLLGIHSLIIFIILFSINLNIENDLSYILFYTILIIFSFLIFNFPKSQMFLGDSGAYLIGALISISVINTNNYDPSISSFFYCILLFYLFFEVFFSFFRKIFLVKQSPLLPDNKHLHMLLYKIILNKNKNKLISNYQVSVFINTIYLFLITPSIFFMNNGIFCRYYFFFLLTVYVLFYKILYERSQKEN